MLCAGWTGLSPAPQNFHYQCWSASTWQTAARVQCCSSPENIINTHVHVMYDLDDAYWVRMCVLFIMRCLRIIIPPFLGLILPNGWDTEWFLCYLTTSIQPVDISMENVCSTTLYLCHCDPLTHYNPWGTLWNHGEAEIAHYELDKSWKDTLILCFDLP